jgi:hypothetical protein
MCQYVCMCVFVCICVYMDGSACAFVYLCVCACVCVCLCVYVCTWMGQRVHLYICVCVRVCVGVCGCVCVLTSPCLIDPKQIFQCILHTLLTDLIWLVNLLDNAQTRFWGSKASKMEGLRPNTWGYITQNRHWWKGALTGELGLILIWEF